jgi:hypothetical protein
MFLYANVQHFYPVRLLLFFKMLGIVWFHTQNLNGNFPNFHNSCIQVGIIVLQSNPTYCIMYLHLNKGKSLFSTVMYGKDSGTGTVCITGNKVD